MNEVEVLDISREAIFTLVKVVTPVLLVALFIGLIVGIFQALTQIQEMTLAFVPKILGVFVTIILLFPFMLNQMQMLTDTLFDKIINGGCQRLSFLIRKSSNSFSSFCASARQLC